MHASTSSVVRAHLKFSMSESHTVKTLQITETPFCSVLIGRKNKEDLCGIIPERIVDQYWGMGHVAARACASQVHVFESESTRVFS